MVKRATGLSFFPCAGEAIAGMGFRGAGAAQAAALVRAQRAAHEERIAQVKQDGSTLYERDLREYKPSRSSLSYSDGKISFSKRRPALDPNQTPVFRPARLSSRLLSAHTSQEPGFESLGRKDMHTRAGAVSLLSTLPVLWRHVLEVPARQQRERAHGQREAQL